MRLAAAERLATAPPERAEHARQTLLSLMDDPMGPVRQAATEALGALADPQTLQRVLEAWEDPDTSVRQTAVASTARIGGSRALQALHSGLDDGRPEIRFQSAGALAHVGAEGAVERLLAVLEDTDEEVRSAAATALGELGEPRAADRLAAQLRDSSPTVVRAAAFALAALGDGRGAGELRAALAQPDWALDAAEALGRAGAREASEDLAALAHRRFAPLVVRAAAAGALARLGDRRGHRVLDEVLRAWRADGRPYAVAVIGELGLVELAPSVARLAERPRGAGRVQVAEALVRLAPSSREAADALARLAERDDEAGSVARRGMRDTLRSG
jgi:HEAT repeat protein